ncbi:MAG: glycosyltransferase family 2 protein [Kiritimatiellae bacterium]|nr:glycosyltransferase family 2 protein [Kiritimatiellia bacterium]
MSLIRFLRPRPAAEGSRLRLLPKGGSPPPLPPLPGSPSPRVGIVIVSFFGLPYLRQCLESVLQRTRWTNFRVVVVDNGSDAATIAFLRSEAVREPRLQVVENGTNLGFAGANNIGLRLLDDCEVLVLLNNDTVVPPGWLGGLARYALMPEIGLVGPVTNWTGNEARIRARYKSVAEMEAFAAEQAATHAGRLFDIPVLAMYCVAFRREVYRRAGALDEGYLVGMFEDQDYADAVRLLGLRVVCCEEVFVHHYGMASFSMLNPDDYRRLFEMNRKYYENKWGHAWVPHRQRS